jgi:hypothetical protein
MVDMKSVVPILGCLLFAVASVIVFLHLLEDDPITAALERTGMYARVLIIGWSIVATIMIWAIREMYVTVQLQRKLDRLKTGNAKLESELMELKRTLKR